MSITAISRIHQDISQGQVVVIDGGTGTELERRGAPMHSDAWCAMATEARPDILQTVHEEYIRAGARVITANTFSTNRMMLEPAGLGEHFVSLNVQAVEVAKEARRKTGTEETVAVAGSMSHQCPIPLGMAGRDPDRVPKKAVAQGYFQELADLLAARGVDLIMLEMMSDPALANLAIAAARSTGLPIWVGISCRRCPGSDPVSWTIEDMSVRRLLEEIVLDGSEVVGVMHTGVDLVDGILKTIRTQWAGPISVYPDTGHFQMPNWVWENAIEPADFALAGQRWVEHGASVIGGCCGTGVEHIRALNKLFSTS